MDRYLIKRLDAQQALDAKEQIRDVYISAFSEPPYHITESYADLFMESGLPRHSSRDGFCFLAARESVDSPIIGFAYGYTGMLGQWWHDVVAGALTPEARERWMTDYFEFVELAVKPAVQGQGIGSRLHDGLLAGLPHKTALLSTDLSETTALKLYRKRGWVTVLDRLDFPGDSSTKQILGIDLRV